MEERASESWKVPGNQCLRIFPDAQFSDKVASIFSQDSFKYSGRFSQAFPIVKLIITY